MLSEEKKQEASEMVNYMEQLDNNGQALVFNLIKCIRIQKTIIHNKQQKIMRCAEGGYIQTI